ncbi:carboxymuconolactone decarboxylase family protein [Microbulbifer guangxiensis]|uniref:carboxymuconolactone decarboxylase family protein n=1 Tax=Microbulbifer guangxiensis TaxID=2904249 RepID=UPI001F2DBBA0|nr:carboxymuconolactone decarboxylase family protein [Microbulbifer guangxiensis]
MSRISLVESPTDDMSEAVFAEIEQELGDVPNFFRAYANHPGLLRANWEKYKALMVHGCLSPRLKQAIALMVAADNHCDYSIARHSTLLQEMGVDPKEVLLIRTNPDHAHFGPKEHAILELARHANLDPYNHAERLVAAAREQGVKDDEMLEAIGVMEMITGFNKFIEVMAVPQD